MDVPSRPILALSALAIGVTACGAEPDRSEAAEAADVQTTVGDIAASAPEYVSVAFENEYARVLRFDLPPGADLPPHEGLQRVIYALSDYEAEFVEGDMAAMTRAWREGDVHAHEPGVHSIRNVGETTASFVVFERRGAPLPAHEHEAHGPGLPTGIRSILDADGTEVMEVVLEPGEAQEIHSGGPRAIYSLTDYTIEWREGDEVGDRTWSAGDAHWHEPGPHAARNVGDTTARWIIVSFGS